MGGAVACVNPATGKTVATESLTSPTARLNDLLTAGAPERELFGIVTSGDGGALVSISPPPGCWG